MGENPEDLANQLFNVSHRWIDVDERRMNVISRLFCFKTIPMKLISLILYDYGILY